MLEKEALFHLAAPAPDEEIYSRIKRHWDSLLKPIDGLGDFEKVISRVGAMRGTESPQFEKKRVLILCGDNGIVEEGVTQTGPEVTFTVASLLGEGRSTASVMARAAGAVCVPVDIGIDSYLHPQGVKDCRIRRGTRNFLKEPAMTEEEALRAIETGMELVRELSEEGTDIIATGEMGIGNTTTSTALLCLLTGEPAERYVGRGAGLDDEGLRRKIQVVKSALDLYGQMEYGDGKEEVLARLCQVGGLDIAALTGVYLGGAACRIPVVVDGLISAMAAYLAARLLPVSREYMIASHSGREPGLKKMLELLELKPLINGEMALGEGTGAIMLLPLLDVALELYLTGGTFRQGGVKEYERYL